MYKPFIIDGPTRTGSTTLAKALNCYPDVRCVIEPFHPRKQDGAFLRLATDTKSIALALDLIWQRWNGLKHVWEAGTHWPFTSYPELNNQLLDCAEILVNVRRRNLLRRHISGVLSKRLTFWVGTRQDFLMRIEHAGFPELDVDVVRRELERERCAIEARDEAVSKLRIPQMFVYYEDLFAPGTASPERMSKLVDILRFVGRTTQPDEATCRRWLELLDPETYQWASREVYSRIPGITRIEAVLGSEQHGWLFSGD